MLSPHAIIELIREDAPCVYDILLEDYHMSHVKIDAGGRVTVSETCNPNPTPDQLLETLTEYSGDNHDVHFWSGRYAQMLEDKHPYYRTIDKDNNILETWEHSNLVKPTRDYHQIQYIQDGKVHTTWNSMYDFLDIPY